MWCMLFIYNFKCYGIEFRSVWKRNGSTIMLLLLADDMRYKHGKYRKVMSKSRFTHSINK